MKKKYVRLTWNGGRVLELTYNEYKMNKEYWDKQQCTREEYWSQQFLLHTTVECKRSAYTEFNLKH